MRSTTWSSVGVSAAHPWRGRLRSPRARRAYWTASGQGELATLGLGRVGRLGAEMGATGTDGLVDGRLFGRAPPTVLAFVAQALCSAIEAEALGPAFGAAGGHGQSFQGVDDDEAEVVLGRDAQARRAICLSLLLHLGFDRAPALPGRAGLDPALIPGRGDSQLWGSPASMASACGQPQSLSDSGCRRRLAGTGRGRRGRPLRSRSKW